VFAIFIKKQIPENMKRIILKITIATLTFIALCSGNANAQFEQKFTLQASGGFVGAFSPESFTDIFQIGFSFDAGAQYNFNRSISMVAMAKYSTYLFIPDEDYSLETAKFNQLGISLCPKVRLFTQKKVNPYIFGGASINYISISFSLDGTETRKKEEPTSIGFIGGLGVDFRVNDNLSVFYQGGVNRVDFDIVWIDSFFQQVGVNINMFKSKSL
jgi:opacity protein-like surface antigen